MTAKEFIEDWYGTPIPPDWDLEHEALSNVTIIQLEDMLKQYTLSVIEKAVKEERYEWEIHPMGGVFNSFSQDILNRVKTQIGE